MRLLISIVFVLLFSGIRAQSPDTLKTKRLDEVVIKSYRLPTTITRLPEIQGTRLWTGKKNEVIQLTNVNANITEKTARQIFAKVPGVFVYDMDGSGNQVNISTRGLDPHRGWEFNIRKDGIITNSDMYGYPASHYSMPMESIERIELVRGTGSLQYGAQFGGMLNYVSKKADTTKKFSFESINSVGSFGLLTTYQAIGGRVGRWKYYAYYNKRVSDGYRHNSHTNSDAQSITLSYDISKSAVVRAEWSRSNYTYQLPGPLTDSMFYADPRQASRSRNFFNPNIHVPSIGLDWAINEKTKLAWTVSAVLGARNSVQYDKPATMIDAINPSTLAFGPRQVDIDHFNSYTAELKVLHQYSWLKRNHTLVTGVQVFNNDLHRQQLGVGTTGSDFDLTTTDAGFTRDMHLKSENVALFVENKFQISNQLTISPGLRLENGSSVMSGLIAYYDADKIPNRIPHQFPLLGVNAQYTINESQNMYGGFSQSYRPVIFKDIIPATTYEEVDKNLKDASGHTFEAGYRGSKGKWQWDVSAFQMRYNNRLGSLSQQNAQGAFYLYRTNIGNSLTRGAEIFVERMFSFGRLDLSLFTSTALFHARYLDASVRQGDTNVALDGNRVESVPDLLTRDGVTLRYRVLSMTCLYSYTASTYADALNTVIPSATGSVGLVPGYGLLDVNTTLHFSEKWSVKLNVNNVANKSYFTKRPSFYPGPGIWPSDGRSWSAVVSVRI